MHVLLTLDLPGASPEARKIFDEAMTKEKWKKLRGDATTTWTASFKSDLTDQDCVRITKADVANSASAAGLSSFSAAIQVGPSAPTTF